MKIPTKSMFRCPYCKKQIDISIHRVGEEQNNILKENNLEPIITVIEETDEDIIRLVTKQVDVVSPTVGDIDKDTYHKSLPQGDYWKQEHKKEIIVLHFTAGYNWEGAYDVFKQPGRVATPFIVDKEGPKYIVKLFDEKYWSYHLGIRGSVCKNWINDKRSIGIEIVNIGPVWYENGVWRDYCQRRNNRGSTPEQNIIKGTNRDAHGGVKFPDKQVEAVCRLVNYLCEKWNIPKQVPQDKISIQLPQISNFKGIVTHQMFRKDKYDMGVAWPWEKMIERCKLKEV